MLHYDIRGGPYSLFNFMNWVAGALNADLLTGIVYQEMTDFYFFTNYVGNQFIIAIRHLRGLWYMANIPWLRAVSRHFALRRS